MAKLKSSKKKLVKKPIKEELPVSEVSEVLPPSTRFSDDPIPKKVKWINKQRVLIFASRGISARDRHLMKDILSLLPHAKSESKMERKESLSVINEICEMKNCNKCIMFEGRLRRDLYVWISNIPNGPSAKFLVENVHTMTELKLTGNCLKGSRPLLSFDNNFKENPHYALLKELFVQVFGTPNYHPKSQPFIDHVMTFTVIDNRIWFRNYQILSEDGALAEIGPRFVLNPIKIFGSSFQGQAVWSNPHYKTPASYRREVKLAAACKYDVQMENKMAYKDKIDMSRPLVKENSLDQLFEVNPTEKSDEIESTAYEEKDNKTIDYRFNKHIKQKQKKIDLKKRLQQKMLKNKHFRRQKRKKYTGSSNINRKQKALNDFKRAHGIRKPRNQVKNKAKGIKHFTEQKKSRARKQNNN